MLHGPVNDCKICCQDGQKFVALRDAVNKKLEQVICAKLGGDGDLQNGELERGKKESTVKRVLTIHSILV